MFNKKKEVVFLGGTCNGSTWREKLIPMLEKEDIKFFNPVVEDWTEEAQQLEEKVKKDGALELYVITPEMTGVFSIAEAVNASHLKKGKVIFCMLDETNPAASNYFNKHQIKSLKAVGKMLQDNGSYFCEDLGEVLEILKHY